MALHLSPVADEEREKIERLTRARSAPVRLVIRARIVQRALQGRTVPAIAQELEVSEKMVRVWLTRFERDGLAGLDDAPRSGRPRTYSEDLYSRVIALARDLPPKPADGPIPPSVIGHWIGCRRCLPSRASPSSAARFAAYSRPNTSSGSDPAPGWPVTLPSSPKKGADRWPLHRSARGQYSDLPR
jgi:hypothetical protein